MTIGMAGAFRVAAWLTTPSSAGNRGLVPGLTTELGVPVEIARHEVR